MNGCMRSPFGNMHLIYADSTASGFPYKKIQEFMQRRVFPFYSNTHSNSINGKYMTELIDESKKLIREHYSCKESDKIIFTGNGCSGAINHLIHAMKIKEHSKKLVVFTSVVEHHSNYLPWKHINAQIEVIGVTDIDSIDIQHLTKQLIYWYNQRYKIIVSFSGSSNVSGVIQDWSTISKLVHSYGGIILWDMAACAPYLDINMHMNDSIGDYMDAIFVSPHKFLGGPGTPGLLIANESLFVNDVPFCPSGGTVRFVCKDYQIYNPNIEIRETGGTPNIIGCIQMGKVIELKNSIQQYIHTKEERISKYVYNKLKHNNNIVLIKSTKKSLPIFSFILPDTHYNLVVVLLSDMFGIQTRGGVNCCSVFAQYVLQLSENEQQKISESIQGGKGVPSNYGWCRVSFHYTMTKWEIDYIIKAISIVSENVSLLKKSYTYIPDKNNWQHNGNWINVSPSNRLYIGHRNYTKNDLLNNIKNIESYVSQIKKGVH